MANRVLIPVQQLLVLFHGYQILAVRLPDNRVAVSLRALCRMLNLSRNGQMERIRRDKNLAEHLLLARVEIAHKPQYMDVLIVEAIPSWALGLHLNLIALERRPLVLALQVEAVHAFHRAFSTKMLSHLPKRPVSAHLGLTNGSRPKGQPQRLTRPSSRFMTH